MFRAKGRGGAGSHFSFKSWYKLPRVCKGLHFSGTTNST